MSYTSSYVHTAPSKPITKVVTKSKEAYQAAPKQNFNQNTATIKIALFIAILSCIVLAVNL
ncbi:MAG: hypothetical protein R2800_08875 [Flavipsychrobacter sp.]